MLLFATACFLLIVTPGPGVLSTAGVGAAYGWRKGLAYVGGLFAGNYTVALLVISGIAAAVLAIPVLRWVLFGASTAYLLYLAAKIAFAGSRLAFIHPEKAPGLLTGFSLQLVNPKAYVVNASLFSGYPFWPGAPAAEVAAKLAISAAIWVPAHFAWLGAGVLLNRLDLPPRAHAVINAAMALAMLSVVAIAVWSTLSKGISVPGA